MNDETLARPLRAKSYVDAMYLVIPLPTRPSGYTSSANLSDVSPYKLGTVTYNLETLGKLGGNRTCATKRARQTENDNDSKYTKLRSGSLNA